MSHDEHTEADPDENLTRPRKRRLGEVTHFVTETAGRGTPPVVVPWALQHYFDGEIDLVRELAARYPQVPVLSLLNLRQVGTSVQRHLATLSTQDGAASLVIEVDLLSQATQFTFILSSMLALRFSLGSLTLADRAQWIEGMRGGLNEPVFLWGERRWGTDYLIGAVQKNFTTLFAFSPEQAEAAVRMTPDVTRRLLDWLETRWSDPLAP